MDRSTVDHLLTTTRSVRKRLDFERPVEPEIIQECLELAIQAPSGSNRQGWRFMVVTDPAKRAKLGELYKKSFKLYAEYQQQNTPDYAEDDPRATQVGKVFYKPSDQGYESQVAARLERWRTAQAQALADLEKEAQRREHGYHLPDPSWSQ